MTRRVPSFPKLELIGTADDLDFSTADYLSLTSHPSVRRALLETAPLRELELELGRFLQVEDVTISASEWAAGMSAISSLVQRDDHVIIDARARSCLRQGASSTTAHVHRHPHLDAHAVAEVCRRIRARDGECAILVVTSSLFATDSEAPELSNTHEVCCEHRASLLVDVTHDLGLMGPGGAGLLASQDLLGKIDLIAGSFSQTFGAAGGFSACSSRRLRTRVDSQAERHLRSTVLQPLSTAAIRESLRIVRSPEGEQLRAQLSDRSALLRDELWRREIGCSSGPSPIIAIPLPAELRARRVVALLAQEGCRVELAEAATAPAMIRLHCTAGHTPRQITGAAERVARAVSQARVEAV